MVSISTDKIDATIHSINLRVRSVFIENEKKWAPDKTTQVINKGIG